MTDTADPKNEELLGRLKAERPIKRSGRVTSPDHYHQIWALLQRAQEVAPNRPVAWMREQLGNDIPWPTMTRWVDVAKQRYGTENDQ